MFSKALKSGCENFFFNGTVVEEHHQEYRYLGFVFHATKSMVDGIDHLVAAGKKAVHAMRRRCI